MIPEKKNEILEIIENSSLTTGMMDKAYRDCDQLMVADLEDLLV